MLNNSIKLVNPLVFLDLASTDIDLKKARIVRISTIKILPDNTKIFVTNVINPEDEISKDAEKIIPPYKWIELMQKELDAGAWKVIGEAREAGNVGLFRSTGEVRSGLVQEILTKIPFEKIIWEAPQKAQQVFFIKLMGSNVNLGNIAPEEVIPLETLRLGLRGDTFDHFLEKK